jgi:ABC-type multidrug transport system fused ATPase/permease subunit
MAKKYWRTIGIASLGVIGAALLNLVTPAIVRALTGELMEGGIDERALLIYAAVLAGAYLLRAGCRWLALAISHVAAWSFVGERRRSMKSCKGCPCGTTRTSRPAS